MIDRYTLDASVLEVAAYYAEGSEWSLADEKWKARFANGVKPCRDMGETQIETQELVNLEGKLYQSYVGRSSGLRYIFVSGEEYEISAHWDWLPVGTETEYALHLIGKVDEGYK